MIIVVFLLLFAATVALGLTAMDIIMWRQSRSELALGLVLLVLWWVVAVSTYNVVLILFA